MSIHISNAGLVLLHPFLPGLFQELYLTIENKWVSDAEQYKAVLILEFLASGNEGFEEFNLMLNKLLCGISMNEIVDANTKLDDEIKLECEDLLNNVITHWSVLRNISVAGLREAFLQRSGELLKIETGWFLKVEKSGVDLLLNQLPWNIGIIKLQWMNESLTVEWL